MKKNLIKLTILSSVFAVGLGMVVVSASNKTASPLEAAITVNTHVENYDDYYYSGTYYDSINNVAGDGLQGAFRKALSSLIFPAGWYTYGSLGENNLSTQLQYADEDPTNKSNMVYLYTRNSVAKNNGVSGTGDWNREHVWPQNNSNGNWDDSTGKLKAGTDILHIRPTYEKTNGDRGNLKYGDLNKSGAVTYSNMPYGYKGSYFEPLDSVKGDVARIVMYVWTAYYDHYGDSSLLITRTFDSYDTLLKWHTMDQPDEMEGHRNDYSETSKQKNRNPFVDHPEYAWRIFGDSASESVKNACINKYPGDGSAQSKQVTSIAISGQANKKDYYAGEQFDPTGLTVTATYDDGTNQNVSVANCTWTPNPLTEGTTSVTCTYRKATATYSGITVIKRVAPTTEGNVFSIEFNGGGSDSGDRLDGVGVLGEATNNTLVKSATASDSDNVFAGAEGLKLGTGKANGSVSFTFKDEASVDIQKIEITTTQYGSDSSTFSVTLGATTFTETGTPGTDYVQNLNDVAASTLTIATDQKRMYINKITVTIKAEEVPPTPGPGDSSSNNPDPTGNTSASSETSVPGTSEQTQPDGKKKAGCSGSILATASLTSFTALIGLVFVFSKKRK